MPPSIRELWPDPVHASGWLGLAFLIFFYYLGVATGFSFDAWPSTSGGFVFNQQLRSLLDLRLDIDPRVIGNEAFVRDERSYTYFGIWSALLRLPVIGQLWRDWTTVYCAMAASIAAVCLLKTTRDITTPASDHRQRLLLVAVSISLIFSGPQLELLGKPSVYVEAVLWGYASCCVFICAGVPLLLGRAPSQARLSVLAAAATAGLLARVSTGLSLYVACGALLAVVLLARQLRRPAPSLPPRFWLLPAMLMTAGIVVSLAVNALRWGNPLEFAPLSLNRYYAADPVRLARLERQGAFSIGRVPDALSYYAAPDWFFAAEPGDARFARVAARFDGPEGPPVGIVQAQTLWLGLAAIGLFTLCRARLGWYPTSGIAAVALGLAVAPLVIASYHYLAFRYRAEFAPLILLFALLGLRVLLQRLPSVSPLLRGGILLFICSGAVWQLAQAHHAARAYACTPLGSYAAGKRAAAACLATAAVVDEPIRAEHHPD